MGAVDARIRPSRRDIDRLIDWLSAEGLDVPVDAAIRLHDVLGRLEGASAARLARLVAPVVARRAGDVAVARPVAERWASALPRLVKHVAPKPKGDIAPGPAPPPLLTTTSAWPGQGAEPVDVEPPAGKPWLSRAGVALLLAAVVGVLWRSCGDEPRPPPETPETPDAALDATLGGDALIDAAVDPLDMGVADQSGDSEKARADMGTAGAETGQDSGIALPRATFLMPTVTRHPQTPRPAPTWPDVLLLVLALATIGAVAWWKSRLTAEREAWPVGVGPPAGPAPRTPRAIGHLIDPSAEALLVWSIDHYVTDESTTTLDVAASVRATAASAGRPHLVFQRARRSRAVWIWIDESARAEHPELGRAAVAIRDALRRANLPVALARFHGDPSHLVDEDGRRLSPVELDERRDTARVAILTDGALLVGRLNHGRTRVAVGANLRMLARWPALSVFEFGTGRHRLREAMAPFEIDVRPPPALVPWLGGVAAPEASGVANELTLWAAACALAPVPTDLDSALALRRHLELDVPAWEIGALAAEAGRGERLWWRSPRRERLMSWLADVQGVETLAAVRGFWVRHFERAAGRELGAPGPERRRGELPEAPQTPQWHKMMACAALVRLWDARPAAIDAAAEELYCYRDSAAPVLEQVQRWAPKDGEVADKARLPWAFAELQPMTRSILRDLRLGGLEPHPPERLKRPGRTWAALGAGLATAAVAIVSLVLPQPPRPEHRPSELEVVGPQPLDVLSGHGRSGRRRLWYATDPARRTVSGRPIRLAAGWVGRFDWRKPRQEPCSQVVRGYRVWLCGFNANPPRAVDAPARSVFVLDGEPTVKDAKRLGLRLLTTGAADQVWFVPDPFVGSGAGRVRALVAEARLDDAQVVVVTRASEVREVEGAAVVGARRWGRLVRELGGRGWTPIEEAWPFARSTGRARVPIEGCAAGDRRLFEGILARCVPAGTYTIGSTDGEPEEKPVHTVTVGGFWLAQTETRQLSPDPATGEPMTRVTWAEAGEFCRATGGRLPSEAEWEIAARGGTTTPWWTGVHFEERPKAPHPWGFEGMNGGVREWVQDAYDPQAYSRADVHIPNPVDPSGRQRRAVRGGSSELSPWRRRTASRDWHPEQQSSHVIGFRCAWDEE